MAATQEAERPSLSDTTQQQSFVNRAILNLRQAWRGIAGIVSDSEARHGADPLRLRRRIRDCLEAHGGEVSARARTAALGHEYLELDGPGREVFFRILVDDFDADYQQLEKAARRLLAAPDRQAKREASIGISKALQSPAQRLLMQFNDLPDGVKFLVDMRAELRRLVRRDPAYVALLDDLTSLLRTWFDVGFLELRRIDWNAPASLLEKLIAYEAVHEISSWEDLKNRLGSDRRCFAYMHPRMPNEPIIFVEVALTSGISNSIQTLLDPAAPALNPEQADTAIFYSISNAQRGLARISFGNFLIKRVVRELRSEFPNLGTFATLSPIPGFREWIAGKSEEDLLTATERKALPERADGGQHPDALVRNPEWYRNKALAKALERPLTRLAARYLVTEKREDGLALDPVAHFHLANGARIEQLNWLGDISDKGLRESAGLMVNYLYDLDHIDDNHEAYTDDEHKVRVSSTIRSLAKKAG